MLLFFIFSFLSFPQSKELPCGSASNKVILNFLEKATAKLQANVD